jgi:hypothetical protein
MKTKVTRIDGVKINMEYDLMKSKVFLLLLLCTLFIGCSENPDKVVTSTDAVLLLHAEEFLNSKGISTEDKFALLDKGNKEWLKTVEYLKQEGSSLKRINLLDNYDYQAIRFSPKDKLTLGGVYWVFLDIRSWEVITYLGFK